MIKDFAYEKLSDKESIHDAIGKYYEQVLFSQATLNSEILYKTINHYKQIGIRKLRSFGWAIGRRFKIADVKSLIEDDIQDTVRNYESLLEVYPEKVAYWNELGMAYRANNQYQLAIDAFQKGLKVEPENVRILNELGITYRENGQYQLAIDAFLKIQEINPKDVKALNELGITYRENGQFEKAIKISEKALTIDPKHKPSLLNQLQVFLFFKPDKCEAKKYYGKLNNMRPAHPSFRNQRKNYEVSIENLDSIWNLEINDFKVFDRYIFSAIQYKAYHTIVPLLFELNKKYPNNLKIISRLGKTLSNQVVCRNEEGRKFLLKAIELFENKQNEKQLIGHIFFYLYNLINNEEYELFDREINRFKIYIEDLPAYYRFLGKYYEQQDKPEEETIEHFKKAIEISSSDDEKVKSINSLLNYLLSRNDNKHEKRIEQLKELLRQISQLLIIKAKNTLKRVLARPSETPKKK